MLTRARNATSMEKERFSMICTAEKMDHSGVKVLVLEIMFLLLVLPLNSCFVAPETGDKLKPKKEINF
jgi:hypothetical protein